MGIDDQPIKLHACRYDTLFKAKIACIRAANTHAHAALGGPALAYSSFPVLCSIGAKIQTHKEWEHAKKSIANERGCSPQSNGRQRRGLWPATATACCCILQPFLHPSSRHHKFIPIACALHSRTYRNHLFNLYQLIEHPSLYLSQ